MTYNIIYRLKQKSAGTGMTARYLERTFPDIFKSYDIEHEQIPDCNRIWRLQKPYFYRYPCLRRINDIVMCRREYAKFFPGIKGVDGYSYYKADPSLYRMWFPTVFQSHFSVSSQPSIGYYSRIIRPESNLAFVDFLASVPEEIPVVTMGDKELIQPYLALRNNWRHTYDADDFWKSCSHYFYYRCSDFQDPFPQSLLEAIQSNHRIISPLNPKRNFKDGIDDFLTCISYDEKFIPTNHGQHCQILEASTWSKFIHELVESKFSLVANVSSKTFYDWICKNL